MMRNVKPRNKLRFIWFGGEELGLLGSDVLCQQPDPERARQDRLRPRRGRDGDAELRRSASSTRPGSTCSPRPSRRRSRRRSTSRRRSPATRAIDYFDSIGLNHELFSPVGTDAFNFNRAGIPASGVLTGQDCCKTQDDVDLFGGPSATSRATSRASTAAASTTRSAGATTSATTTRKCSRSCRRASPTWSSRWPSTRRCPRAQAAQARRLGAGVGDAGGRIESRSPPRGQVGAEQQRSEGPGRQRACLDPRLSADE